jgi:hypothetical protein
MAAIHDLTADELSATHRRGELSPVEVVQAAPASKITSAVPYTRPERRCHVGHS